MCFGSCSSPKYTHCTGGQTEACRHCMTAQWGPSALVLYPTNWDDEARPLPVAHCRVLAPPSVLVASVSGDCHVLPGGQRHLGLTAVEVAGSCLTPPCLLVVMQSRVLKVVSSSAELVPKPGPRDRPAGVLFLSGTSWGQGYGWGGLGACHGNRWSWVPV